MVSISGFGLSSIISLWFLRLQGHPSVKGECGKTVPAKIFGAIFSNKRFFTAGARGFFGLLYFVPAHSIIALQPYSKLTIHAGLN
jgi:hypothetical protein